MRTLTLFNLFLFIALPGPAWAQSPWERGFELPGEGRMGPHNRSNILQLSSHELARAKRDGRRHIFSYPVEITELTIPYRPFMEFFDDPGRNSFRRWVQQLAQGLTRFDSPQDVMAWLGVHPFPAEERTIVRPEEHELGMGATVIDHQGAQGLTFSCAACHTADLFGKKVVGLTNRFPRANEFFSQGKTLLPLVDPRLFQLFTHGTPAERTLLERSKHAIKFVGAKKPQALGLDTSLAQVALSLSRRGLDEYATRFAQTARSPRPNPLSRKAADSKPAVWWNVKYKTRWLSDGSIVQGNPILTNFLWNEIGRGVDLKNLETWLLDNQDTVDDLTAAVFATEAPAYLDFLPADTFNISLARAGQTHFNNHCLRCHGRYEKAWDTPSSHALPLKEQVRTVAVHYHRRTPVMDVGTDPGRYEGMRYFAADLNRLKISQSIETVVEPQKGYVPPPLVGIWARWPYFHNNSAPSLCAVLTKTSQRPVRYVSGPAVNSRQDYDSDCGGYPTVDKVPAAWKRKREHWYDTRRDGLSKAGHDEGIFLRNGQELMTPQQKRELIEFLKTL